VLDGRGEDLGLLGWKIEAAMRDELAHLPPSLAEPCSEPKPNSVLGHHYFTG